MSGPPFHAGSDPELVAAALRGDASAYAELVRRRHAEILGLCLSLLRDPSEAEDAAQEVFIKAYRSLAGFGGRSSFHTWLYRIASNHCLDLLRRKKREKSQSLDALMEDGSLLLDVLAGERDAGARVEGADLLDRILGSLSPEERVLVTLREAQGLSYIEMSRALDCSVDAIKSRLKRTRQKLRGTLRHLRESRNV